MGTAYLRLAVPVQLGLIYEVGSADSRDLDEQIEVVSAKKAAAVGAQEFPVVSADTDIPVPWLATASIR